ncbi:MAG: glutamate--tRNA ligase [Patescibacteria group bacterium]|nr:glutamate--tRNA ligase [Patescibacteria group bacterium]
MVRTRFAPSPTGYMHIGNFRSALYAYIFAKQNKGKFVLRIEDTDKKRYVEGALNNLIITLNWAGLNYDEGVFIENNDIIQKGDFGPYIQSERLDIYKKHALELVKKEKAYYCFCTEERLEEMRKQQIESGRAPMYDRRCLNLSKEEIDKKIVNHEKFVIRQKIEIAGFTEYNDLIRGKISIKNDMLDDQILLKSDGYPTYNFANVIDDHLMEITHVIRGEEYISSTPKYIQLYNNFDWQVPFFAHLPLLLNPDRTKLSKRQGDVSVEDYIKKGYLRDAIINFVAFLGWNPGQGSEEEFFNLDQLVEKFDLKKVHKSGAIFDLKKLDWINSHYIKNLSADKLYKLALPYFEQKDFYKNAKTEQKTEEYLKKVLGIEKERLNNLSEVGENNKFFFMEINYEKELLLWKKMTYDELKTSLNMSKDALSNISEQDWTKDSIEKILLKIAKDKRGELLWPLRACLTGEKKSPSPFEVAFVLGKNEVLKRLDQALNLLK